MTDEEAMAAFYRARLDEETAAAEEAMHDRDGTWTYIETRGGDFKVIDNLGYAVAGEDSSPDAQPWWTGPHIARHDPARTLRQIAARRRVLDEYVEVEMGMGEVPDHRTVGYGEGLDQALRLLMTAHDTHPDYRETWLPFGDDRLMAALDAQREATGGPPVTATGSRRRRFPYLLRARLKGGRLVHAAERKMAFCADGYALTACNTRVNPTDNYLPDDTAVDCPRCARRLASQAGERP